MNDATFQRLLRQFWARLRRAASASAERDMRRQLREERGLIFVREYTVRAHFVKAKRAAPRLRLVHGGAA
jgi:hypothetical protein